MTVEEERIIETERVKDNIYDLGPGVLSIELPCGYIDGEGTLHDTLVVKEMTGVEEDILTGKGQIVPRLNKIISNCTVSIGSLTEKSDISNAVSEMTASDRLAALIALRRVSLGDFYDIKVTCPNKDCNIDISYHLDLSEIKVVKMKEPMVRNREDTLSTGRVVHWHIMSHKDEEWLSKLQKAMKKKKQQQDVLTLAMLSRVDKIDIAEGDKFILYELDRESRNKDGLKNSVKVVKELSLRERNEMRRLFTDIDGSVETELDFECSECEQEWKDELSVWELGFFFPSGT